MHCVLKAREITLIDSLDMDMHMYHVHLLYIDCANQTIVITYNNYERRRARAENFSRARARARDSRSDVRAIRSDCGD